MKATAKPEAKLSLIDSPPRCHNPQGARNKTAGKKEIQRSQTDRRDGLPHMSYRRDIPLPIKYSDRGSRMRNPLGRCEGEGKICHAGIQLEAPRQRNERVKHLSYLQRATDTASKHFVPQDSHSRYIGPSTFSIYEAQLLPSDG
jgi:hypothetical protein